MNKYISFQTTDYTGKGNKKETEILKSQALKRNGNFKRSYIFGERLFTFNHNNLNIVVEYKEEDINHMIARRIKIKTKFKLSKDVKLIVQFKDILFGYSTIGLKNIQTENTAFNEKFILASNENNFALELINPEIQNSFLKLGDEYYYPIMKINDDKFRLMISNFSTDFYESEDYDNLIDVAVAILDNLGKLCRIQIPGIDF